LSPEDQFKFIEQEVLKIRKDMAEERQMEKTSFLSIRAADLLGAYKKKRDFDGTSEPEGNVSKENKHRFVIQKHDATNLHFDLRLENDKGVLQSWAVPKHKLPEGKEKLLAVETEPHPIEYAKFEGDIEEGYGEGHVDIWASGKYEPIEVKKDKIIFEIKSGNAKGKFVLFRTDGKRWMLMRKKED
jgi:DNA ligase D-like protein (predicted 3'-phosphoesterase)